MELLKTQS